MLFVFYSVNYKKSINYWFKIFPLIFLKNKSKEQLKELFFIMNFKGQKTSSFNEICNEFSNKIISKIVKKTFANFLSQIPSKYDIVIVSASIKNYLIPWANNMGVDLICTELEEIDGKLTGNFSTSNCNGVEKVRRVMEKYDLKKYDEIHVFGNSKGDYPMMNLGTHKYYKYFK